MRLSRFPLATLKENPAGATIASHRLMLRAGMIKNTGLGLYSWQPLGLKVLRKIEKVVRDEMDAIGCLEVSLPLVQPLELWETTGRSKNYGPELLVFNDRNNNAHCLGPTHEEVITKIASQIVTKESDFPQIWYQIDTKFRDEIRPRYGVMRAREFLMKDAYSFHSDVNCLENTYQIMHESYQNICKKLGLDYAVVSASSGEIGGSYSHEFHVLADTGEDYLATNRKQNLAYNVELIPNFDIKDKNTHIDQQGNALEITKGIEIGHIFQLQDTYTKKMNYAVNGNYPLMGCYGIGISRICAAAIEQKFDEKGIIWSPSLSPFRVAIAMVNPHMSEKVVATSNKLYEELKGLEMDVLLDDRGLRIGQMLSDLELIGIPLVIVVGDQNISAQKIEIKPRVGESEIIDLDSVADYLRGRE